MKNYKCQRPNALTICKNLYQFIINDFTKLKVYDKGICYLMSLFGQE